VCWRFHDNLHVPTQGCQPTRKPINRDALHATAKNFGKGWLIRSAELRRFLLRQLSLRNRVFDGNDQTTLSHKFRSFGRREANIQKKRSRCPSQ